MGQGQSVELFQACWFISLVGGGTLIVGAFTVAGPFTPGLAKLPSAFAATPQSDALGLCAAAWPPHG